MRQFYVYILAGHSRQLYTGVTSDLPKRVFQHRAGVSEFTSKYCISRLVYFETTENVMSAIARKTNQVMAAFEEARPDFELQSRLG